MIPVGELRNAYRILVRKVRESLEIEGRIVLLWSAVAALSPWSIP